MDNRIDGGGRIEAPSMERGRRQCLSALLGVGLGSAVPESWASGVSAYEAAVGVKSVLEQGTKVAVSQLGTKDGFLGNRMVRIPMPNWLHKAADLKRAFGQGAEVNALIVAMNRAAEASAPEAGPLLLAAIRSLNVRDPQELIAGGDTAVTDLFSTATREAMVSRLQPVVTRCLRQAGVTEATVQAWEQMARIGLNPARQTLDAHVNAHAVGAFYTTIGEHEKRIRQAPQQSGSALLGRVFGVAK